ncbi:Unknown protein [Striga hermonthica]|uniref:Uncharacterized protein n=1 Tax=Striga hermonthica TaxID=68872 RepID=A0A9N7R894_STRHE|nr:Unknown protein [Striga hermonthica]
MEPEYAGSGSDVAKPGIVWKQTAGHEEKKAAIAEEMKRMRRLPPNSSYAAHRLRLLDKIYQLLLAKRTNSQDEELELLFAGLHI